MAGGLYLLDYGAGNVRSLANSLAKIGYDFEWIQSPEDFDKAKVSTRVGAFQSAIVHLTTSGLLEPLKAYIVSGKPYFGICIGMQVLFESSTENPDTKGLGIIPATIEEFGREDKAVPHMGWNSAEPLQDDEAETGVSKSSAYYFVHSFRAPYDPLNEWAHSTTQYGQELFLASVRKGNVFATQFHPEKSGEAGLRVLKAWLSAPLNAVDGQARAPARVARTPAPKDGFIRRVVACMDVRANDQGDLVVTKGDQYDVREKETGPKTEVVVASESPSSRPSSPTRAVRNLGKPVALAKAYYDAGADEICLLNITSFRSSPLRDQPMLAVVRAAAAETFVPLTIGGGIKDTVDPDGTPRTALEVAGTYFRAGADKVSIGSEAVVAVEAMLARPGQPLTGTSPMETISQVYGRQAVVVSIDPRKVYVTDPADHADELVIGKKAISARPEEKDKMWWYQATTQGGRTNRPLSVVQLAKGAERLGAGEILLNSIDRDGTNIGYDLDLVGLVKNAVKIPVVASSGAGKPADFVEVFEKTGVEAALAAGIFHRNEVKIPDVKAALEEARINVREDRDDSTNDMSHQPSSTFCEVPPVSRRYMVNDGEGSTEAEIVKQAEGGKPAYE
ncbi:glutamine amidotransferase [Rhizoctonia solani]|uniref:Glutamine amidotransferase n=1 Tax=Rhizoctonia solani TaxID=456999 RepID=A0A0K6GGD0_9AGAM|nr:glutamine amidotransferase [Rhizoctonia solani]